MRMPGRSYTAMRACRNNSRGTLLLRRSVTLAYARGACANVRYHLTSRCKIEHADPCRIHDILMHVGILHGVSGMGN